MKTEFKGLLVRKLKNKGIIGAAHKPEENFLRFVKKHHDRRSILSDYEELIRDGVIVRQKKNKGIHVSLTKNKKLYVQYLN